MLRALTNQVCRCRELPECSYVCYLCELTHTMSTIWLETAHGVTSLSVFQAGVDWTMMQRFNLLKAAVALIPKSVKEEHVEELLRRHHAIEFSPRAMAGRICHCLLQFPEHVWSIDSATEDLILVCYPGPADASQGQNLPSFVPFADFMSGYIKSAPAFRLPELHQVVYPISKGDSVFYTASKRRYLVDGSWMSVKHGGHMRLHHGASIMVVSMGVEPHVVLNGANGLHALMQAHNCEGSTVTNQPVSDGEVTPQGDASPSQVPVPNIAIPDILCGS